MPSERGNTALIIGAGSVSRAVAHDFTRRDPALKVVVLDRSSEALYQFSHRFEANYIRAVQGSTEDTELIGRLMTGAVIAVGCASYRFNQQCAEIAVDSGTHWIDLGGNNDVVQRQFELDTQARDAGVTVVPDCGLAPGMTNVIAGDFMSRVDAADELHIRVGGLPQFPQPPLYYKLLFSAEGLINEYVEPARVIRSGVPAAVPSLTGLERLHVGAPFGTLEAFHTSGGSSTLIESFEGRIKTLDYKTLRYPGHLAKIKILSELGLFSSQPIAFDGDSKLSPRRVTELMLERLGRAVEDVTVVRAWGSGVKDGKRVAISYSLNDHYDAATGLSSMARTTGLSAAIMARMILDGRITKRGVVRQELEVPADEFFSELAARGILVLSCDSAAVGSAESPVSGL